MLYKKTTIIIEENSISRKAKMTQNSSDIGRIYKMVSLLCRAEMVK